MPGITALVIVVSGFHSALANLQSAGMNAILSQNTQQTGQFSAISYVRIVVLERVLELFHLENLKFYTPRVTDPCFTAISGRHHSAFCESDNF